MSRISKPNRTSKTAARGRLLALTLLFAGLDQAVKFWISQAMQPGQHWPIWPGIFQLTLTYNTGAAFSVFNDQPQALTAFASLLFLGIAVYAWTRKQSAPLEVLSLALILGGALGNLMDRFRLGKVVDFLDAVLIHYPVFNLADTFIFCGVALLLWTQLASRQETSSREELSHEPPQ